MRKFSEWTVRDSYPEKDLDEINPISVRAYSLISRNESLLYEKIGAIELLGVLKMMEGLDYHYGQFLKFKNLESNTHRIHEIVAYLNRVGQIYYFLKSDFTKNLIEVEDPLNLVPTIKEIIVFRKKATAHRSIDSPFDETIEYRNRQALAFIGFQTNYFQDFERFILPTEEKGKTKWNYFTPEIDHPKLILEIYRLVEELLRKITSH
ncbi:MAG: hypothetical protein Tsb004_26500 [Allomuricauda sp.]